MTYDNYGNIVKKNGKAYTYGNATWKDLLTGFDGKTIEYDAQGNPVKYLGHTLTWEKGRQLKSFDGNTYTYNANGIRTSRTVNGVTHNYTLDGTKILKETWEDNTLIPLYDNEDSVCGIIYNDYAYYFLKNLQGDIIAITNNNGKVVASYTYDAWGVCTIVSDNTGIIARINPFRYRGDYFDQEIGLYYLQSRYYDASVGRFINGDDVLMTIAYTFDNRFVNLFTYSDNIFTVNYDPNGAFSVSVTAATIVFDLIILAIILAVSYFASAKAAYKISRFSKWLRGKFDAAINKLAYWIADSIDTLFYNLLRHYNSIGKTRLAITAKYIANFISTLIALTPGAIIAKLIDRFDKDGYNGRITF